MQNIDKRAPVNPRDRRYVKTMWLITILLIAYLSIAFPSDFLSKVTLQSVTFQFSELGIFTLAMALSILLAGIDLSVIATANLAAIFAAMYLKTLNYETAGLGDFVIAGLIAAVTGLLCGLINGILVGFVEIPAILATLATMTLYGGLAIGITGGHAISNMPPGFAQLGSGTLLLVPIPFIVFAVLSAAVWFILEKTPFGQKIYLTGTNIKAAKYSGIDGRLINFKAYTLMGVISAAGGMIVLSRTNAANPDYGSSYVLTTILIVALGGISVLGGKGKIMGVLLAVVLLQLISTLMSLYMYSISGSNFFKDFAWGILLLGIIALMNYLDDRARKTNGSKN